MGVGNRFIMSLSNQEIDIRRGQDLNHLSKDNLLSAFFLLLPFVFKNLNDYDGIF